MSDLGNRLFLIQSRESLPPEDGYRQLVERSISAMTTLSETIRPRDRNGKVGGMVIPPRTDYSIIVPDLHGRPRFLYNIVAALRIAELPGEPTVLEALERGLARIIFLGDGFHTERQCIDRWRQAWTDYAEGNPVGRAMTEEMRDSLSLMELVMELISSFPDRAFFLKGNHENVRNESTGGNHGFRKFADEGNMVLDFLLETWGEDFVDLYASFERTLPLCALCERFIATHAEPAFVCTREDLVDYLQRPDVVEALTWTGNDASVPGTVERMLAGFFPDNPGAVFFGGHRIVADRYALRAGGKFIQLHDPDSHTVALADSSRNFDPERDIREVP